MRNLFTIIIIATIITVGIVFYVFPQFNGVLEAPTEKIAYRIPISIACNASGNIVYLGLT